MPRSGTVPATGPGRTAGTKGGDVRGSWLVRTQRVPPRRARHCSGRWNTRSRTGSGVTALALRLGIPLELEIPLRLPDHQLAARRPPPRRPVSGLPPDHLGITERRPRTGPSSPGHEMPLCSWWAPATTPIFAARCRPALSAPTTRRLSLSCPATGPCRIPTRLPTIGSRSSTWRPSPGVALRYPHRGQEPFLSWPRGPGRRTARGRVWLRRRCGAGYVDGSSKALTGHARPGAEQPEAIVQRVQRLRRGLAGAVSPPRLRARKSRATYSCNRTIQAPHRCHGDAVHPSAMTSPLAATTRRPAPRGRTQPPARKMVHGSRGSTAARSIRRNDGDVRPLAPRAPEGRRGDLTARRRAKTAGASQHQLVLPTASGSSAAARWFSAASTRSTRPTPAFCADESCRLAR